MEIKELKEKIIKNPLEEISSILWGSNQKIGDIPSLIGESPLNCSSKRLGYCNICKECYAISDYKQYPSHKARVDKSILFFELLKRAYFIYDLEFIELFESVLKYFEVTEIRYNLEGDFKNVGDINFLSSLARRLPKIKFYGYSKRQDLRETLESALQLDNFYCGVNFPCKGANQFIVTPHIYEYEREPKKCLGDCGKCRKCFNLKGESIACFIHGSPSKIQGAINTPQNWEDLSLITQVYLGISLTPKKGLFCKSINEILESNGFKVPYNLTKKGNKSYQLNTVPKLIKYIKFIGRI